MFLYIHFYIMSPIQKKCLLWTSILIIKFYSLSLPHAKHINVYILIGIQIHLADLLILVYLIIEACIKIKTNWNFRKFCLLINELESKSYLTKRGDANISDHGVYVQIIGNIGCQYLLSCLYMFKLLAIWGANTSDHACICSNYWQYWMPILVIMPVYVQVTGNIATRAAR